VVRGEIVILATHHPSESLQEINGTAINAKELHRLLNDFPCVKLHIAGHWHIHAVFDRGGYTEIVTGSIIDPPQEGRVIELWRKQNNVDDPTTTAATLPEIQLRYLTFSHLEAIEAPDSDSFGVFDDPFLTMREEAAALANNR